MSDQKNDKILEVKNLKVSYHTYAGEVKSVRGVSFDLKEGEAIAIVGESGCGKSVTAKSIMGLIKGPQGEIKQGSEILYHGDNILNYNKKQWQAYKGGEVAIIFQDALASLNPTMRVGKQIMENLMAHKHMTKDEAKKEAVRMLQKVGIPEPEKRVRQYPHEFSGGQRQRIGIARALALRPSVLLADEATSGLDPQATASVLTLLKRLRDEYQLAIVLITHEMDAVRTAADAVAEIRDGTIVQYGRIEDLLARPDSLLGQQLLPLTPAAATHSDLLLRLSYRWDVPVATDWISRLSQQWALQIDLLGGHVEVINGRLAGRLQAGVRFQGERLSPARLQGLLAQLGITAEILDSAPLLREAV